jgi:hypothetical protein
MEDVFSMMGDNCEHADITDDTTQSEHFDPLEAGLLIGLGATLADEKEIFTEEDEDILAEIAKEERRELIAASAERVALKNRGDKKTPLPPFEQFVMDACRK